MTTNEIELKIKKLLELSKSDNKNEANLAFQKAEILIKKHNIKIDSNNEKFAKPKNDIWFVLYWLYFCVTMMTIFGCFFTMQLRYVKISLFLIVVNIFLWFLYSFTVCFLRNFKKLRKKRKTVLI